MDLFKMTNTKRMQCLDYRFIKKYCKGANRGLKNDKVYLRRYARRKINRIDKEIE